MPSIRQRFHLSPCSDFRSHFYNYVHIAVTSTLNNSSKVRVEVRKGLFRLQRILPVSDAEVEYLRDQVFEHRAFEEVSSKSV